MDNYDKVDKYKCRSRFFYVDINNVQVTVLFPNK